MQKRKRAVYAVFDCVEYEGDNLMGLYATKRLAEQVAAKHRREQSWMPRDRTIEVRPLTLEYREDVAKWLSST